MGIFVVVCMRVFKKKKGGEPIFKIDCKRKEEDRLLMHRCYIDLSVMLCMHRGAVRSGGGGG